MRPPPRPTGPIFASIWSRAQPSWLTPLWNTTSGGFCHFWQLRNYFNHWPTEMACWENSELKVGLVRLGIPTLWCLSDSCVKISAEWSQSYARPRFGLVETTSCSSHQPQLVVNRMTLNSRLLVSVRMHDLLESYQKCLIFIFQNLTILYLHLSKLRKQSDDTTN